MGRNLHPKPKTHVQEHRTVKEENSSKNKDDTPMQKGYVDGKVIFAK